MPTLDPEDSKHNVLATLPPFKSTRRRGIPWSADLANGTSLVIPKKNLTNRQTHYLYCCAHIKTPGAPNVTLVKTAAQSLGNGAVNAANPSNSVTTD